MSRKNKVYVVHYCPRCDNCFVDEDKFNAKTIPPHWKLCKECCKELGIDFNKQNKPKKEMSEAQKKQCENFKSNRKKSSN